MTCEYCNASSEDLKLVQLRARLEPHQDPQWQCPKWVCKSCRKYLGNLWRYARETQDQWLDRQIKACFPTPKTTQGALQSPRKGGERA